MYLGVDLSSKEKRPSGCAALDAMGALAKEPRLLYKDAEILDWALGRRPQAVAIDAPLSLPRGLCCLEAECPCEAQAPDGLKAAERELRRRGVGLYVTSKRSIIKAMVYRGIKLRRALEQRGIAALEVYPYACKVALFGRPIPKKSTRAGRAWLQGRLAALVPGLSDLSHLLDHDALDAVVAAHTAYLHGCGRAEAVGDPEEGMIYLPDEASGRGF